ncbi:MAG: hypothetical protein LBP62_03805 [Clostridiales bacterium]|jgi:hypothetical protein|nr:hypothetical protein [Clostridiales bacterium]
MIKEINFYQYKKDVGAADILFNNPFSEIKGKLDFVIEDETAEKDDWQTMYMEQYLNADATEKICKTYDEPADDVITRNAF